MKMIMSCHLCHMDMVDSGKDVTLIEEVVTEFKGDGIYNLECSKGHRWTMVTTDHNYQILFELGYMALTDGYTREAITSFATSLERFYEYMIEVLVTDEDIGHEKYKKTWSNTANSQRQIGAFYFLYLMKFDKAPPIEDGKFVKLRNDVVHKGYIPSEKETNKYGNYVFQRIMEIHQQLFEEIKRDTFETISDRSLNAEREKQGLEEGSPFVIGLNRQTIFPRHIEKDNHMNVQRFEDVFEYIDILKDTIIRR